MEGGEGREGRSGQSEHEKSKSNWKEHRKR